MFVEDGIVKAAVQERFSRKKHDPNFPINALMWIMEKYNLETKIDYIAYYENPNIKQIE